MTKILGFAGKRQSGKTTSCNIIACTVMTELGFKCTINEKGELIVLAGFDDGLKPARLDLLDIRSDVQAWLNEMVWPFIKIYSFADLLKECAVSIFGLTPEQVFGTDEQKSSPVPHLIWRDMPGVSTKHPKYKKNEPMSGREFLQYFGTDVCRRIYNNVWVDSTIRRIQAEGSQLALIGDVRFPNECRGIQDAGGKIIYLERAPFKDVDTHESEFALDDYPLEKFDAVIDNTNQTIPEQALAIKDVLTKWNFLGE